MHAASHFCLSKTEVSATISKMRDVISYKNCNEIENDLCFGEVLKSDDENKKDELFYVIAHFIEKDEFIDSFFGDINWNKYKENKTVLNDHKINWSIPNLLLIDCTKNNVLWDEEYLLNKKIIINYKF